MNNKFKEVFSHIKNIFNKKDELTMKDEIKNEDINVTKEYSIKNDNQYVQKRNSKTIMEEIIKLVEENPDMLEKLDVEKLEIIDKYYKQKIIERKKILNKKMAK